MLTKKNIILLLALLAAIGMQAQKLRATLSHFSTENGLVSNAISDIKQDDYGYLWIATWNGLSRFDGYNFYNYRTGAASHVKNLHNRILYLQIDKSQNVWMHMYDERVFVLDRSTDKIRDPFDGIAGSEDFRINSQLLMTSSGQVFVSVKGNDLYAFELSPKGLKREHYTTHGLRVTSLAEGYQNDIWLGTNEGLHLLDKGNMTIEKEGVLTHESIYCLCSNTFNIYAATGNGSIYTIANGKEPQLVRKPTGNTIGRLFVDSKKRLWFCDKGPGAYCLDPQTGKETKFTQEVREPEIDGQGGGFNEVNGTVWVKMNHGGYGYYNPATDLVEYFHNNPRNPWNLSNTVHTSQELPEGVIWETTNRRGLERLEIQRNNIVRKKLVENPEKPRENEIRAMYYDTKRKLLLMGNKNSTLYLFYDNGQKDIIKKDMQGNPLGRIYGISKDSRGNYWICSKDDGLFRMSPNGSGWDVRGYKHEERNPESPSSDADYMAVEDKDGNIWVASYGGGVKLLLKSDIDKGRFLSPTNGMPHYPKNTYMKVRTIETDAEGNIWAGTTDGVLILKYEDNEVKVEELKTHTSEKKMLMSNDIVCIERDNNGVMWIGTNGGGIGYTTGKDDNDAWAFETFDASDGLPSEEIRSITFDQRGNTWFATEHTICSFDKEKGIFTTFSYSDGVDNTILSECGAVCIGNEDILFGTLEGYYVVDRQKLMATSGSMLKLQITDFFIDGKIQSPRLDGLHDHYVPNGRSVEMPQGEDNFAFRFAAMNYQLQHRIHYQYMLEGYDEEWHNAEKDRMAIYSDIPSGHYIFKVKAFLLESPEQYDIRTMEVIIPPFFLLSTPALIAYAVIALLVVLFLLYRHFKK